MRLIVVRHGQTSCNIDNIWHGWDQCALTAEGHAQAGAAGERLATERIATLYSSPSRRAVQTALAVGEPHSLAPILDERLRERNAGEYEGVPVDEVVKRNPAIWDLRARDYWHWRPPGGESFREVLARTLDVVERLRVRHADDTVAIVTHMGPARVLASHLGDIPIAATYEMEFPSTGVSIFRLEGEGVTVETLNDAGHVSNRQAT